MAAWQIQKVLSRLAWRECAPEICQRQFPARRASLNMIPNSIARTNEGAITVFQAN